MDIRNTQYAGFWRRVAASIIDSLVLAAVGGALLGTHVVLKEARVVDGNDVEIASLLLVAAGVFLFFWLYPTLMESSARGGTLGKMALGIAVRDVEGRKVSFLRALGRHFVKQLSPLTLGVGLLMAAFTGRKQALHDMVASCVVVRSRERARA